MWGIINRTIFWELLKIFLISLFSITALLLLAVVVIEAQNQGLGPVQILLIIPLVIPSTLPYTIPATTLFATCVVYGRLAHDNEVLAIKSAGINVLHVVRPAIFLGVTASIVTATLYHSVIPTTYHLMKTVFLTEIENVIYARLKRDGRFAHPKVDYQMEVRRVEGKKLIDPIFLHRDKDGVSFDVIVRAREAELRFDMTNKRILVHMRHCHIAGKNSGTHAYVEDKIYPVDFPPDFGQDRKERRTDMTWDELYERRSVLRNDIAAKRHEIAATTAKFSLGNTPDYLAQHLELLRNELNLYEGQIRRVETEIQRRPALALGCLCFVLIGCPVGMWFSRSDYLSAFVTCFLPIVLLYYPLILCGENLSYAGKVEPVIAVWSANAILGLIAGVLYWRLLKN